MLSPVLATMLCEPPLQRPSAMAWVGRIDSNRRAQHQDTLQLTSLAPPEQVLDADQTAAWVDQGVQQLRQPRDREVLRRHDLEGEDKRGLCAGLGLSSAHFDRILCNARCRLRAQLHGLRAAR